MKKKKLKLNDLKIQSFVTEERQNLLKGGFTGNCGSFINITCPDPKCDFKSIPLDECAPDITNHIPMCSNNCTDPGRGCTVDQIQ
ncbi:MAG: pinensin family lanthipeptide [Bacteroidota bacterium]